jgi:hypothetical protein
MKEGGNIEATVHKNQQSSLKVKTGYSLPSIGSSGWASFCSGDGRLIDPQHEHKATPGEVSNVANHYEHLQPMLHHRLQSLTSNPPLSTYGSEIPSDPDREWKSEDYSDHKWIEEDEIAVNEVGRFGLSRRGMLGIFQYNKK